MRFNKTLCPQLVILLSVTGSIAGLALPARALPANSDISIFDRSVDKGINKNAHHLVDSPRAISVSIPGLGKAQITVKPETGKNNQLTNLKGDNIEVKVPQSMQQVIEDGHTAYGQVSKDLSRTWTSVYTPASKLINSFVAWLGSYFKQAGTQAPVTITPGGYPYVSGGQSIAGSQSSAGVARLAFTREGRIKTLVSR